jgi:hypothetical protein
MKRVPVVPLKGSSINSRSNVNINNNSNNSLQRSISSNSSSSFQAYNNNNMYTNNYNNNNNNNKINNQSLFEKPTYDHFISYYIFRKDKDEQSGKPISTAITVLDEWLDMKTDSKRTREKKIKIDWKQLPAYGGKDAEDHVRRRKLELELDNPSSNKRYIHSNLLSEWETYEITEIFQLEWCYTMATQVNSTNNTINTNNTTSNINNSISSIETKNKLNSSNKNLPIKKKLSEKELQREKDLDEESALRNMIRQPANSSTSSNKSKKYDLKGIKFIVILFFNSMINFYY